MSQAHAYQALNESDYLDGEARSATKHELVGGQAHAMAGASERHNRISGNLFFHLRGATRGKRCRAFMADMKLRLDVGPTYYYPDVMLVCDPEDNHSLYKRSACFIAEVLSPATAKLDRREKWPAYSALPGLRYFLLADSECLAAKLYFRDAQDQWFEQELSREDRVEVACGDAKLTLTLDDIYEDTGLLDD